MSWPTTYPDIARANRASSVTFGSSFAFCQAANRLADGVGRLVEGLEDLDHRLLPGAARLGGQPAGQLAQLDRQGPVRGLLLLVAPLDLADLDLELRCRSPCP